VLEVALHTAGGTSLLKIPVGVVILPKKSGIDVSDGVLG
jgi:hypothetical protein